MDIAPEYLIDIADRALQEDLETGDLTTLATVSPIAKGRAMIRAKADGIISGLDVAALVFYQLDQDGEFLTDLVEGSPIKRGQELIMCQGKLASLLTGERTALNFLMHLSGIATLTAKFVEQVKHTSCQIIDTRKTTPGLRLLEKRAVFSGGGANHRMGLFDMILIKENHIAAAGSLTKAVEKAIEYNQTTAIQRVAIEVETRNLDEVREAASLDIQRLMLDNFDVETARAAVNFLRAANPDLEIEASGNMSLATVKEYAETGVDFISAGALTHSAQWLDLSMKIV
ncbi:MAG: carboxylating nicotinate-nucleotide diphosphorylase [bacterium]|nr:carboxylating nicotinate-nucleotide diphosphorylase [bacterium]